MKAKLAVLASGRGTNLQAIIDAWRQGNLPVEIVGVLSNNPSAPALARARANGIATAVLELSDYCHRNCYGEQLLKQLHAWQADIVALAGFMFLIPPLVVTKFRHRILNVHPSLLPSFKGLNAQKQALEYGVRITGCTIHLVDEGLDTGPIVMQAPVPVLANDTVESLSARILKEEHRLYPEAIRLLATGKLRFGGAKR